MFRTMPWILFFISAMLLVLDPFLSLTFKQGLYSISLTSKSIIVLLLPFIIFGLLFKAAVRLSNNATKLIGAILLLVCASNFFSTFLSHYVGMGIYHFDLFMITPQASKELTPLWVFNFPKLIANDAAMFAGIILGLLVSRWQPQKAYFISEKMEKGLSKLLQGIVYFIPLFVAGFVVKLKFEGIISIIIKDYTAVFALIACAQFGYIALVYFLLNNLHIKDFLHNIKNMLPAAISGFSTMSSAASMPLTIIGTEKNVTNKEIAGSVIPATVNIHLVGDCFAIPIFAYAILKSFGAAEPALFNYLIFSFYFVLAKFSVAAIPGGGILVMLPILENYLGFNADMLSLMTAVYILFDPAITCANVLGNGAFAKLIDKGLSFFYPLLKGTKNES